MISRRNFLRGSLAFGGLVPVMGPVSLVCERPKLYPGTDLPTSFRVMYHVLYDDWCSVETYGSGDSAFEKVTMFPRHPEYGEPGSLDRTWKKDRSFEPVDIGESPFHGYKIPSAA